MGTTIGFALSQDFLAIFILFLTIGVGFSAPYWVAALLPSHHIRLPKPGLWTQWVERSVSLLLVGTCAWLIFLLTQHQTRPGTLALIGLCSLCFIGLLDFGRFQKIKKIIFLCALMCVAITPLWQQKFFPLNDLEPPVSISQFSFEPEKISALVREGKVVVVDLNVLGV